MNNPFKELTIGALIMVFIVGLAFIIVGGSLFMAKKFSDRQCVAHQKFSCYVESDGGMVESECFQCVSYK